MIIFLIYILSCNQDWFERGWPTEDSHDPLRAPRTKKWNIFENFFGLGQKYNRGRSSFGEFIYQKDM